jgi:hypothetical protein
MSGNLAQVKSKIQQCAERIYYRLDMWRLKAQQRPKTPMPPVGDFRKVSLAEQVNITPAEVAAMKEYAAGILRSAAGANWQEFSGRDYASLRSCLAPAGEVKAAEARR